MSGILEGIFTPKETETPAPEFKQSKKYRLCTENNPDEEKYRCGKKNIIVPACKLSLYLDELTSKDLQEIELERINLLDRNGFVLR